MTSKIIPPSPLENEAIVFLVTAYEYSFKSSTPTVLLGTVEHPLAELSGTIGGFG